MERVGLISIRTLGVAGLAVLIGVTAACAKRPAPAEPGPAVELGVEVLLENPRLGVGARRVGLVTHAAGIDGRLRSTVDRFFEEKSIRLVALFSPEHGIRGSAAAGEKVEGGVDPVTRLPVRSLYGQTKKPTPEMLADIDVLVVDLQDIGSRSYTYISTLYYVMEAAAEQKKQVIVCDRPNPMGGLGLDGPVLDPAFRSFIGVAAIPVVHGMTIGELAWFFNNEFGIGCDLKVIQMRGWKRTMTFRQTGLYWVPPSPHIPTPETVFFYPITGLIGEMGTLSEGVGTPMPFQFVGSPWMDGRALCAELPGVRGVAFRPMTVKPFYFRYVGQEVNGAQVYVTDPLRFRPVEAAVHLLVAIRRKWPNEFAWHPAGSPEMLKNVDSAWGTDQVRKKIDAGESAEAIIKWYRGGLREFARTRNKYLMY